MQTKSANYKTIITLNSISRVFATWNPGSSSKTINREHSILSAFKVDILATRISQNRGCLYACYGVTQLKAILAH